MRKGKFRLKLETPSFARTCLLSVVAVLMSDAFLAEVGSRSSLIFDYLVLSEQTLFVAL